MNFPPVKAGREIVLDMINYELDTSYLLNQITIGAPVANSTSGRNTRIQVTLPSQGQTESVFALYNRLNLGELFMTPVDVRFQNGFVNKSDLLASVFAARNIFIEAADISDGALNVNPNTATFPIAVTVSSVPTSLSFTGQFTIRVQAPAVVPPDPDPEEDDMHYRAYPTDVQNFYIGGNLINVMFGEVSTCGAPTICVSSHPVDDEILTITNYQDLTLVSANLYQQTFPQAVEVFDAYLTDIGPSNPSSRAYTTPANKTLITTLTVGTAAADSITLVPAGAAAMTPGEEYQVIAQFTYPGFTKPIYFYQRIRP